MKLLLITAATILVIVAPSFCQNSPEKGRVRLAALIQRAKLPELKVIGKLALALLNLKEKRLERPGKELQHQEALLSDLDSVDVTACSRDFEARWDSLIQAQQALVTFFRSLPQDEVEQAIRLLQQINSGISPSEERAKLLEKVDTLNREVKRAGGHVIRALPDSNVPDTDKTLFKEMLEILNSK